MNEETHFNNEHAEQPDTPDYFFDRIRTLGAYASTSGEKWPFRGFAVEGHEMSSIEQSLYALTGVLELLHAESDNVTAVDNGHIHARKALGGRMADRLHYAADVLAWNAYYTIACISERAREGKTPCGAPGGHA